MDRIETEKTYPQRVEVVNALNAKVETSAGNPLVVIPTPDLISGSVSSGNYSLRVVDSGSHINEVYVHPIAGNFVNGFISCVHVLNSSLGYIFPINQDFFNISKTAFETQVVPSLFSCFQQKFPSSTSIVVFYSSQNANRLYTFGAYSGES